MGTRREFSEHAGYGTANDGGPIFSLANQCDTLFNEVSTFLGDAAAKDLHIEASQTSGDGEAMIPPRTSFQRHLMDSKDRFDYWVSYLGVFSSASIDKRLKKNRNYRALVVLSLDMLRDNLQHSTHTTILPGFRFTNSA
jgi:hypothetical protein